MLSAPCCHSCSKTVGFFLPVSKINYTGNKYLTIQSQAVQNMKLHSEYCLFVFRKIYVFLSSGRENFSERTVLELSPYHFPRAVLSLFSGFLQYICFNHVAFKELRRLQGKLGVLFS